MDVETAAAMIQESNVTRMALRVINRYMRYKTGRRLTPSEKKIDGLTDHMVKPVHAFKYVGEEKIHYWWRNIAECVTSLADNEVRARKFDSIDLVFGGDQGQGKFSAGIKVIFWEKRSNVYESILKVGHIKHNKDSYEVLKSTIGPPLNEYLQLVKSKILRVPYDCDRESQFVDVRSDHEIYKFYKINVVGCGDIKFIMTCLGRELTWI